VFAEHELRLGARQKDGFTTRQHLESVQRATGRVPEGLIGPPCPPVLRYLWRWFLDLSARRGGSGFGPAPLAWSEVAAWARLTRLNPTPWEVDVLLALDDRFLAIRSEAK